MNGYLTLGLAGLTIAAVALAGIQSTRLSTAHADLATATERLTEARTERDQAVRDRTRAVVVLARERDRAVASERIASTLREMIARDAGTDRDGPTAPVLRDTVQGLHRTGWAGDGSGVVFGPPSGLTPPRPRFVVERQDSLFIGRMLPSWDLLVTKDGRLVETRTFADRPACVEAAKHRAIELIADIDASSIRIRCTESRPGERA